MATARLKDLLAPARMRELFKKYGKVGLGVHFSISAASTAGLYAAINNNVDVQSLFDKIGIKGPKNKDDQEKHVNSGEILADDAATVAVSTEKMKKNRTAELAASSGGAFALALLCNKFLFPVRAPITLVVTPPLARFLARRQIIKATTTL